MAEKLYYIENPGPSPYVLWWAEGDNGYTDNIDKARVFTEKEISEKYSIYDGKKIARLKSEVDKLAFCTLKSDQLDNMDKCYPDK